MKEDAQEQLTGMIVESMAEEIKQELGVQRGSITKGKKRKVPA